MMTTNNFLGCLKLETGGLIIGWISLVGDVLSFIIQMILIVLLSFIGCDDLKNAFKVDPEVEENFDQVCGIGKIVLVIVLVISAAITVGFFIISYLCIKGVQNRDYVRVRPLMIVMAIGVVLSLLNVLSFTLEGFFFGIVGGAINGYCFVVLYSLFKVFQSEYQQGYTVQTQYQGYKV